MAQKILFLILGLMLCVGGAYCMMTPGLTYTVIAPLAGIGMIFDGVASIMAWNAFRKAGGKDALMMIGAIVSLVLGISLLVSFGMQMAYDLLVAYLVAFWLIISGVARIASGWKMGKSIPMIIIGVLITLCGIGGLINPISIMMALGMIIGLSIMVSGIGVLSFAFMNHNR